MALSDTLGRLRPPVLQGARAGALLDAARAQLSACMPRRLRRWLAARRPVLVVSPAGERAAVSRQIVDEREPIGSADLPTGGDLPAVVTGPKQRWSEIVLELPAEAVLLRTTTLPAQVRENLHGVMAYELDRLTPFTRAEVYYDARAKRTLARGAKIEVELAVCPREQAADWLRRVRESGAPASRLSWPGAWPGANLLPPAERPPPRRLDALLTAGLAVLVLALIAAAMISPLAQRAQEHEMLSQELRQVRAKAQQVSSLREELERARLGGVQVLQSKREQPRMTDLLRELTDLLPDGTWVQTLNYREGSVDLRGESDQATALIALLEKGPGIRNVSFRSPVMQIGGSGSERFHIAFDYQRPAAE